LFTRFGEVWRNSHVRCSTIAVQTCRKVFRHAFQVLVHFKRCCMDPDVEQNVFRVRVAHTRPTCLTSSSIIISQWIAAFAAESGRYWVALKPYSNRLPRQHQLCKRLQEVMVVAGRNQYIARSIIISPPNEANETVPESLRYMR
jgi:hypothetical protein